MTVPYALLALLPLALALGLAFGYFRSGLPDDRRKLRKALAGPLKARDHANRLLRQKEHALDEISNEFLKRQRWTRLGETSIDILKDHGATGVRLSSLRSAGLETLGHLHGLPASRLSRIRGIGPISAGRIARSAASATSLVLSRPPDLPGPDLAEPLAPELGEAALACLDAHEELDGSLSELNPRLDEATSDLRRLKRDISFWKWLVAPSREGLAAETAPRKRALLVRIEEISSLEALRRLERGHARLRKAQRPLVNTIRPAFREKFAACSSLIEAAFHRVGVRSARSSVGGLPEEIAQAVEAYSLDTSLLRLRLRRYQEFGAKYLLVQERTILGDEMGLGKTIEALAVMCHLYSAGQGRCFLVVAPAGTLWNWMNEVSRHSALTAHLLHPSVEGERWPRWLRDGGVAITSYDVLGRLLGSDTLERLAASTDFLVADEAHYAKNPDAKRSQAIREVAGTVPRVCLMSGTPLENRLEEFFRLAAIVRPEFRDFRPHRVDPATFQERMSRLYLRRNQKDVLRELPELIEVDEWVDLLESDAAAYARAVREGNFMAMRQAATLGDRNGRSAKMLHLDELLEDHRESGRKVLIFSYFLDVLSTVAQRFHAFGTISGSVSPAERQRLIDTFQEATGHQVLACQIVSGGHGVNLQAASAVVITEPQLKPSTEQQAIARAHRMGQTERVIVHRLLARNSVDERLVEILQRKKEVFDEFARDSSIKGASAQATDTRLSGAGSLGAEIVEMERRRLGIA